MYSILIEKPRNIMVCDLTRVRDTPRERDGFCPAGWLHGNSTELIDARQGKDNLVNIDGEQEEIGIDIMDYFLLY